MGILEFEDKPEYIFFCLILMFLEESEEQFLLSTLTEYIQSNDRKEAVDWTISSMRRHLILSLIHIFRPYLGQVSYGPRRRFCEYGSSREYCTHLSYCLR